MIVKQLNTGVLNVNTYLAVNREQKRAFAVDPGGDADYILRVLKETGATLSAVLLTHCHMDHVGGVSELVRLTGAPVYASEPCKELVNTAANLAVGMFGMELLPIEITHTVKDGEIFPLAGISVRAIYTPGHTADSCCYLAENALFTGDTIFYRSAGRCDLPTGSAAELARSVREKLFTLCENYTLYPGHGERTTLFSEKKNNPFFG